MSREIPNTTKAGEAQVAGEQSIDIGRFKEEQQEIIKDLERRLQGFARLHPELTHAIAKELNNLRHSEEENERESRLATLNILRGSLNMLRERLDVLNLINIFGGPEVPDEAVIYEGRDGKLTKKQLQGWLHNIVRIAQTPATHGLDLTGYTERIDDPRTRELAALENQKMSEVHKRLFRWSLKEDLG